MPSELAKFQNDLLESVKQMRRSQAARVTKAKVPDAAEARARVALSQQAFAVLFGVSPRTLQDWGKAATRQPERRKLCFELPWNIQKFFSH